MGLDEALDDGQAQPRAAPVGLASLPEAIEEVRDVVRGYPASVIADPEHHLSISWRRANRNFASSVDELEGVADQVLEDLEQALAIRPQIGKVRRELGDKRAGRRDSLRPVSIERVGHDGCRSNLHRLDRQATGLEARDIQKVRDQAVHSRGGSIDRVGRVAGAGRRLALTAPEELCIHPDRPERIAEIMGH
ncbi:MAG TPA: hypothetical protein VN903_21115, partial [Polyangia bacterium]|nr:hypothetical protein [Polyangia bacterium]